MNVDFVLPLYFKDLTDATNDFSDEEFGAYLRLLIHQWSKGSIPSDVKRLTRIAESSEKNWNLLKTKFIQSSDTTLKNKRLEEIKAETIYHQKRTSKAGKLGADSRWNNKHDSTLDSKPNNTSNGTYDSKHDSKSVALKNKNKNKEIVEEESPFL